jgi:PTS system nitrogen regulatory IIA component
MKIADFLTLDFVIASLAARDKPSLLAELAAHIAKQVKGVEAATVERVLVERERLASTAIGEGVAIPHGKLEAVGRLVGCVGRAIEGIDFESIDGRPTHLFFVLLAPENATALHLKALARISRLCKEEAFRTRLNRARDAQEMYKIIVDEDAKYS